MSELPEKVIVSSGCHKCPFSHETNGYLYYCYLDKDLPIEDNVDADTRHAECPLLTHTIKVVKRMSMANGFPFEQYQKTTYLFKAVHCRDEKPIELKQKPRKHWENLNKQAYKGGKK